MKPRFTAPFAQPSLGPQLAHFVAPVLLVLLLGCGVHEEASQPTQTSETPQAAETSQSAETPEVLQALQTAEPMDSERKPMNAEAVFVGQCAGCHGAERYGGYAPPLIPQALSRKKDDELVQTILEGRPNTQMAPFNPIMQEADVRDMVAYLRTEVGEITWGIDQIRESWREIPPPQATEGLEDLTEAPVEIPAEVLAARKNFVREDVILVVERGTSSISMLNGESLMEVDRFEVGRIHGGPKFDRDYKRIFAVTRDGTVVGYDLENQKLLTKVKAGVNTRNVAVSPDAEFVAVASQLPEQLVIFDGKLNPLKLIPLEGQPSAVYHIPGEKGFMLTLRDNPKLITVRTPELTVEETALPENFEDFMFVPGRRELLASSRKGSHIMRYDLDEKRVVGSLETEALPHLFSACFFDYEGKLYAALNHIGAPKLTILDIDNFRIVKEIPLEGSGFFARTHRGSPYIWVDTNTEKIQLVDKKTLSLLPESLVPEAGKKAMHVEFDTKGSRAFVSVWDQDGWVVVYDAESLEEKVRLPYKMPIGKYNAYNKTRFFH